MGDVPFEIPVSSAIPGAITNLMAQAPAILPPDTYCWFGGELPAYTAPLTFLVTEAAGDQVPASLGTDYRREETFQLVCSLVAYAGGTPDHVAMTTSLMGAFSLLSMAIANNPQLWGAVRFAQVGNFHVVPQTDGNGQSIVQLDFSIRCEQRVKSLGAGN